MTRRPSKRPAAPRVRRDKLALYEASVQGAEYDLDFMERIYRRLNHRTFFRFREDFCGTALVAAHWALRRPENHAWGVDLDARGKCVPPSDTTAQSGPKPTEELVKGGCGGCAVSAGGPGGSWWILVAVVWVARRRRRGTVKVAR